MRVPVIHPACALAAALVVIAAPMASAQTTRHGTPARPVAGRPAADRAHAGGRSGARRSRRDGPGKPLSIAAVRESIAAPLQPRPLPGRAGRGRGRHRRRRRAHVQPDSLRSIERIVFRGHAGAVRGSACASTIVERYGASPSLGRLDAGGADAAAALCGPGLPARQSSGCRGDAAPAGAHRPRRSTSMPGRARRSTRSRSWASRAHA